MNDGNKNTVGTRAPGGTGSGGRFAIVAVLVIVVVGVFWIKDRNGARDTASPPDTARVQAPSAAGEHAGEPNRAVEGKVSTAGEKLPRLVDLGAGKCIPCKKMAPILEELKKEFAGRLDVEFIDVWVNPNAGDLYQIKLIPTQIFYDASGKELFRHEGFFSREDILGKWKELGVNLQNTPVSG
jgi:thioredoxin 1